MRLFSTVRFRLAVFAAARVPSCLELIRSRIVRAYMPLVSASANAATGIVEEASHLMTAAMSSGGPASPRSRALNAHVASARRISPRG